jgi:hypothetical protein
MKLLCTAWVLVMAPDIACDASAWLASRCCCSLSEPHVAVHPQAHGFFRAFKAVPASRPLARRASMASVPWSSAIRESRHACTKGGSHCDTLRNFRLSVICRFTARLSVRLAHGPRPRSPSLNSSTSSISPSGSSLISSPSVRFPCLRGHSTSRREQIGDRYMCTCQTRSNRVILFPDGHVADRLHVAQLYDSLGDEPERLPVVPLRRFAGGDGDDPGSGVCVPVSVISWCGALIGPLRAVCGLA